jgi:hypothetical protein
VYLWTFFGEANSGVRGSEHGCSAGASRVPEKAFPRRGLFDEEDKWVRGMEKGKGERIKNLSTD